MRTILFVMFGLTLLVACGGEGEEGGTPPADEPRKVETPVVQGGVVQAAVATGKLELAEWEWFLRSPNRMSRAAGRMRSHDGKTVAGGTATLLIPPPVPMAPAFPVETVVADENGAFEFRDVPINAWIGIEAAGHGGRIFLAPELQAKGAETEIAPLRPAGGIRGVVRLPSGEPIAGVDVMVSDRGPRFAKIVRTDQNGRFEMRDVSAGTLGAWIMSDAYQGSANGLVVKAGETMECQITATKPEPITLKVVDGKTGMALAGATGSTLFTRERVLAADDQGVLRIDGSCFPRVWFRARGYGELLFDFPVNRDVPMTRTVEMMPGGTVRGRVVDEAGEPIAGARVEVIVEPTQPGLPIRGPLSAEDGSFEVSWIPVHDQDATCAVVANWPDHHLEEPAMATLKAGEVAEGLTVVLGKNRTARLRVLRSDGQPAAWAVVGLRGIEVRRVGANPVFHSGSSGVTGADGVVEIRGLAPGPMEVEVRASGHVPVTVRRDVGKEATTDFGEVRLEKGLSVSGIVKSSAGKLPEGAVIRISGGGNLTDTLVLSEDGKFHYEGLPRGRISMRVRAPGHEPAVKAATAGEKDITIVLRALSSLTVEIDRPEDVLLEGWLEVKPLGGRVSERDAIVRPLRGKVDSYVFPNVVAGKYRVRVGAGDHYAYEEVTVPQGEPVTAKLAFKLGCTLAGTILRPDGEPAKRVGVTYTAAGGWGRRGIRTNDRGQFQFRGVPPGEVRIETHPVGFAALATTVTIVEGGAADLKLMLKSGGRIYISVKDGDERPLPGIRISLTDESGQPARFWVDGGGSTRTGGDGTLVLIGLTAGTYHLSLFRGDSRIEWGKVPVEEEGTSRVKAYFRK